MKIKDIAYDERPRERLHKYGQRALSNAELLAIILRQGSSKHNVIELAQKILQKHTLEELSRRNITNLTKVHGVGQAKASQIVACFELGRRAAACHPKEKIKINSAQDIVKFFLPEMSTLKQEHFIGVFLDTRRRIIKQETIFIGTINSVIIHPREIFQIAINEGAAAIILIHNHPSGDPEPSDEDVEMTKQIAVAGKIMGIQLIDHIIIGNNAYVSLQECGYVQD